MPQRLLMLIPDPRPTPWYLLLVPLILLTLGCGSSETKFNHVSGTITYGGQPVPRGTVMFQPDSSKGGSGPAGLALIRDGRYDTAAEGGKGVTGGPFRVRIVGLDGKPVSMGPDGVPLFPDYTTTVTLPPTDTTHDFDIPAQRRGH